MNKKDILKKLSDDKHYYGDFGKKYLSASDVGVLLNNPLALKQEQKKTAAFLVGGYFHTTILEPDKLKKFKVIPTTTRNTKLYKEMSNGELCLLQQEVDKIELMSKKMLSNEICNDLIHGEKVEFEKPMVTKIGKYMWKGKCDVLNFGNNSSIRSNERPFNNWFEAKKGIHSEKPELARDIIDYCYPKASKIELFARRRLLKDNWSFWGNEI